MKLVIVALLWITCVNFGCKGVTTNAKNVYLITVKEMDSLVQLNQVQVLDVRTPEEYSSGHLQGALNIDYHGDDFKSLLQKMDKTKPVGVYCAKGRRSRKSAAYMSKAGFVKIYDLDGGIIAWKREGGKVVK